MNLHLSSLIPKTEIEIRKHCPAEWQCVTINEKLEFIQYLAKNLSIALPSYVENDWFDDNRITCYCKVLHMPGEVHVDDKRDFYSKDEEYLYAYFLDNNLFYIRLVSGYSHKHTPEQYGYHQYSRFCNIDDITKVRKYLLEIIGVYSNFCDNDLIDDTEYDVDTTRL